MLFGRLLGPSARASRASAAPAGAVGGVEPTEPLVGVGWSTTAATSLKVSGTVPNHGTSGPKLLCLAHRDLGPGFIRAPTVGVSAATLPQMLQGKEAKGV